MLLKKLFGSVVFILFSLLLYSQAAERSIINTAGDVFSSESFSLQYTIGDIATETFKSQQLTLTQGFIQPDKNATNNIKHQKSESAWTIHPNPTKGKFSLYFEQYQPDKSHKVSIYDLHGRLTIQKEYLQQNNSINIKELKPGTYFVKTYINELQNRITYKLLVIN